jgi:hypothetical protein
MPAEKRKGIGAVVVLLLLISLCGTALAGEAVPPSIAASFESFSTGWMSRLAQVSQENSRTVKPEAPDAGGRTVGRYICYGPDCVREVRATGSRATPYVGILRYAQKAMEKEGETPQKMKEHPGVATGEIQVTEVFRYSAGRWVY